jgi:hypothetical protein
MSDEKRFDPWTATFEEARALQESWTSRGGPIFQQVAAQTVLAMRESIDAGDGGAVLAAVGECAREDLVMPGWLAEEYLRRWRLVTHAYVPSWDDAFGLPWPKGIKRSHLARKRHRYVARLAVFNAVTDFVRSNPAAPLDPEWDRIAREAGVSKSVAQDLYYKQSLFQGMSASDIRESQGWPRVPKKFAKLPGRRRRR